MSPPLNPQSASDDRDSSALPPEESQARGAFHHEDSVWDSQLAGALQRLFSPTPVPPVQLELLPTLISTTTSLAKRNLWRRMVLASAVAAAAAMVAWLHVPAPQQHPTAPRFTPLPLAQIYQELVDDGFEPYYECHDLDRFQSVFQERLGVALTLAEMPAGSRMLGLSYPGGLSRETTAMLCEVEGKPVLVFVDRLSADQPEIAQQQAAELGLNALRLVQGNLVLYELTPYSGLRAAPFLKLPSESQ